MKDGLLTFSYISPNGNEVANPVLVKRQIDALRIVLRRMKAAHSTKVLVKKQIGSLREVRRRMRANTPTLDPFIAEKLTRVTKY